MTRGNPVAAERSAARGPNTAGTPGAVVTGPRAMEITTRPKEIAHILTRLETEQVDQFPSHYVSQSAFRHHGAHAQHPGHIEKRGKIDLVEIRRPQRIPRQGSRQTMAAAKATQAGDIP